jgi:hypothetical protein
MYIYRGLDNYIYIIAPPFKIKNGWVYAEKLLELTSGLTEDI